MPRSSNSPNFEVHLHELKALQPRLATIFQERGLTDAARAIRSCSQQHRCKNRLCTVCNSIRAIGERAGLLKRVTSMYQGQPQKPVVFALTPQLLDSSINHRERALELVRGTRALVRSLPSKDWFATTEVEPSTLGDHSLNIHGHVLLQLDSPPAGRNYVRTEQWEQRIEEAWQKTSPALAVNCAPSRLTSLPSALCWARYLTGEANLHDTATGLQDDLDDPDFLLEQQEAVRGVSKFYGSLSRASQALKAPR